MDDIRTYVYTLRLTTATAVRDECRAMPPHAATGAHSTTTAAAADIQHPAGHLPLPARFVPMPAAKWAVGCTQADVLATPTGRPAPVQPRWPRRRRGPGPKAQGPAAGAVWRWSGVPCGCPMAHRHPPSVPWTAVYPRGGSACAQQPLSKPALTIVHVMPFRRRDHPPPCFRVMPLPLPLQLSGGPAARTSRQAARREQRSVSKAE